MSLCGPPRPAQVHTRSSAATDGDTWSQIGHADVGRGRRVRVLRHRPRRHTRITTAFAPTTARRDSDYRETGRRLDADARTAGTAAHALSNTSDEHHLDQVTGALGTSS